MSRLPVNGARVMIQTATNHAEGWILRDKLSGNYWHYRGADGCLLCMRSRGPCYQIHAWADEPKGRNEACPDCRRRRDKQVREQAELERAKQRFTERPVPEAEPEVLALPEEEAPAPAAETPPAAPAAPPEEPAVTKVIAAPPAPAPTEPPPPPRATLLAVGTFADRNGWPREALTTFMAEKYPDAPRLGDGARAPIVMDQALQARVLVEFPAWQEERRRRRQAEQAPAEPQSDLAALRAEVAGLRRVIEAIATELGVKLP